MKAQLIPRFSTSAHTQESLGTRLLKAVSESDLHHVFTTKSDTCVCGTHSGSSRVAQFHSVRMASFVLIDSTFSYKDSEKRCTMETFIALVIQRYLSHSPLGQIALRYMDCLPASTTLPELQDIMLRYAMQERSCHYNYCWLLSD